MKNKFIPLDCGDDVILFENDTYKVSKLRELVIRQFIKKWRQEICTYKTQINNDSVGSLFGSISAGNESIPFSEIKLNAVRDCQVLKVDGKGWQKGKLEIKIFIYPNSHKPNNVCLEFHPHEPLEIK
ncbi:MAG TPA: KGK domain-containing protein [Nostoc sp.]|uniref:KGK domain-containing protein n=1 Tax=Nostoc sp. TaxID=1180 RepID=UPI002D3BDD2B|nr:KGK domain-containing protein [Nostoc sp.]HYX14451.1 KGK domain-containing protein [Nostoc sp.]